MLSSTVFIQAGTDLSISTVEGSADVIAFGHTETAMPGMRVRVPLDANMRASGPPGAPETYNYPTTILLPLASLPRRVLAVVPPAPSDAPVSNWQYSGKLVTGNCPNARTTVTGALTIKGDEQGDVLWLQFQGGAMPLYMTRTTPGNYRLITPTDNIELRVVSATRMEMQHIATIIAGRLNCSATYSFELDCAAPATP